MLTRRPSPQPRSSGATIRRVLHGLVVAAAVTLVGFHAWLLWTHLTLGSLLEPGVAFRWAVAGGLLAAFTWLRRTGVPLVSGRKAGVLWVLVVLLHCHAAWAGDGLQGPLAVPQSLADLAPAGLQFAAALSAIAFLTWLALQYAATHLTPRFTDLPSHLAGLPASACSFRFLPRPPPTR